MSSAILFVVLTAMFCTCKNGGVDPPDNTADTTSHNFTWHIDTLGDGNASVLNDVAIINDTLVYAVGEIYLKDSTGQIDPQAYNVARWDAKKWTLLRVPTQAFGGSMGSYPIKTVFAFGSDNVWTFSVVGSYSHWDGLNWTTAYVSERSGGGMKLWGSSSSNLYLVGTIGSVSRYNGSSWQKLNSGTSLDVLDIWGSTLNGQTQMLALASLQNLGRGLDLLSINGTSVSKLDTAGLHVNESGIWFDAGKIYYVVGNGVFSKPDLANASWVEDKTQPLIYKRAIRGNSINDVFIVGDFGLISHYNGSSWKTYSQLTMATGSFLSVAVRKDFVVAVGFVNNSAVVVRGSR